MEKKIATKTKILTIVRVFAEATAEIIKQCLKEPGIYTIVKKRLRMKSYSDICHGDDRPFEEVMKNICTEGEKISIRELNNLIGILYLKLKHLLRACTYRGYTTPKCTVFFTIPSNCPTANSYGCIAFRRW